MTITILNDIQQVLDHIKGREDGCAAECASAQSAHPALDLATLVPKIVSPQGRPLADDNCQECAASDGCCDEGCAVVPITGSHGHVVRACICCVRGIRRAHIAQEHAAHGDLRLCYSCVQRDDDYGLPHTSSHKLLDRASLETRIAAGLVTQEDAGALAIHDLVHADDKHCRACLAFRHPQCVSTACPDFVEPSDG